MYPKRDSIKNLAIGFCVFQTMFLTKLVLENGSLRDKNALFEEEKCKVSKGAYKQFKYVPLLSFPGCGNTWLRYLVEQATGYQTTTVEYGDAELSKHFSGEFDYPLSGQSILAKTHYISYGGNWYPELQENARTEAKNCVLLIRRPTEAFLAEIQRKIMANHTKQIDTELIDSNYFEFSTMFQQYTGKFIRNNVTGFTEIYRNALRHSCKSSWHVVFYENLVMDTGCAESGG